MSKKFEEFYNAQAIKNRVCSVSYTLNDEQPVICTYIGDQPLHYMDEEVIEEEIFDISDIGFLAQEIRNLKNELNNFNTNIFFEDTVNIIQDFEENIETINKDFSLSEKEQEQRLEQIKNILGESRLASTYLNIAQKNNINILMSSQIENSFYDRSSGLILINPNMDINEQIILLSKELRRHWQHRQGVLINPMMFQPENAILVNRAQQADLAVSMIRIAWELQLAGNKDVWEWVENSSMADLSRAYAREAFIDFRTINNGIASAAVFESWFLSERCRQHDKEIIQAMLADYNGYVFDNDISSKHVTVELISALGSMPFGKNYLSGHAHIIMDDPIFTEVRDRSSANFLWFIKFERTFKETEQYLQLESDLSTRDIRHDLLNKKEENYENDQSADIIQLFEYEPKYKRKKSYANNGCSAQIIDIKFWSNNR